MRAILLAIVLGLLCSGAIGQTGKGSEAKAEFRRLKKRAEENVVLDKRSRHYLLRIDTHAGQRNLERQNERHRQRKDWASVRSRDDVRRVQVKTCFRTFLDLLDFRDKYAQVIKKDKYLQKDFPPLVRDLAVISRTYPGCARDVDRGVFCVKLTISVGDLTGRLAKTTTERGLKLDGRVAIAHEKYREWGYEEERMYFVRVPDGVAWSKEDEVIIIGRKAKDVRYLTAIGGVAEAPLLEPQEGSDGVPIRIP